MKGFEGVVAWLNKELGELEETIELKVTALYAFFGPDSTQGKRDSDRPIVFAGGEDTLPSIQRGMANLQVDPRHFGYLNGMGELA